MRLSIIFLALLFFVGINTSYADDLGFSDFSDCAEWRMTGVFNFELDLKYQNEVSQPIVKRYECGNDDGHHTIGLSYIARGEALNNMREENLSQETLLQIVEGMDPLFITHEYSPRDKENNASSAYLYEKTRKWYEFYRLWQPQWRLAPDKIPRAMNSFSEAFAENRVTALEAYTEFEKIHPFFDGNGRVGDLLWKIAITRETGQWPEELPPKIKFR